MAIYHRRASTRQCLELSTMRYDINMIEQEMTAAGSHWWDRSSMRFFRCRVNDQVYQGTGGVYFVTSEKYSDEPRKYTVRQYNPATKEINTVGEFNSMTRSAAHVLAKNWLAMISTSRPPCISRPPPRSNWLSISFATVAAVQSKRLAILSGWRNVTTN